MLHVELLESPTNYLVRFFGADNKYGDAYDAEIIVSINVELGFIEAHGLNGKVTRRLYIEGVELLRKYSAEYNLPVVAERTGRHRLPFFELRSGWWFLK